MTTNGNFNVNNVNTVKVPTINMGLRLANVPVSDGSMEPLFYYDDEKIYYLDMSTGRFYVAPIDDPRNAVLHFNTKQLAALMPSNIYPTAIGDYFYSFGVADGGSIWAAPAASPMSWYDTGANLDVDTYDGMVYVDASNIYVFGGYDNTNLLDVDTIDVAPIGTPTVFTTSGNVLPAPRRLAMVALVGSTIYMYGGTADGSNSEDTIFSAPAATPTVWTDTLATLPRPIHGGSVYVDDSYIYIFGGEDSTMALDLNEIYRAPIGTPTTFTLMGSVLPADIDKSAIFVSGAYIYLIGTQLGPGTGFMRATVADPVTTWTELSTTSAINTAQSGTHVIVDDTKVYAIGGLNSAGAASTVIQSALKTNPVDWSVEGNTLPAGLHGGQIIKTKDYYYLFGGDGTGNYYRATLAAPTSWTLVGATGPTETYGRAIIVEDQVWYFGGESAGAPVNTGWKGLIVDGELLHWQSDPGLLGMNYNLPVALSRFSLIQAGDYIYIIGGRVSATVVNSAIYRAPTYRLTNSDTLATWVNIGTLLTPTHGGATAIINNNVYVIGGSTTGAITASDDYIIQADMTDLANGEAIFVEENSAGVAIADSTATVINDELYLIGGRTATNGVSLLYRNHSHAVHNLVLPKVPESLASLPTVDFKTGTLGSYSTFQRTGMFPWLMSDK